MFRHAPPPKVAPDKTTAGLIRRIEDLATFDPATADNRQRRQILADLHNLYWTTSAKWEEAMAIAQQGPDDRKLSLNDMRDLTGLSRSTVQSYIKRARDRLYPKGST